MTIRFFTARSFVSAFLLLAACLLPGTTTQAQTEVAGAFEGRVTDVRTKTPIAGATVRIRNVRKGLLRTLTTDTDGRFYQGLLEPDVYEISVQKLPEYAPATIRQTIFTNQTNQSIPLPVELTPAGVATTTPTPDPTATPQPGASPTPTPQAVAQQTTVEDEGLAQPLSRTDGRRGGVFTEREVSSLPLGGSTLTRTFDELAFLLPGVALPPQTQGIVAGPGVGAGVGTSGQFSVNGLRSRSNNFTVDGSDNNDEDIGVRRQGFFSLVPQPIESIKEYQVITLLAPAQFGRNFGAQVNAVSKSGGNDIRGTLFGFFNSSQLNARNPLDTANGNAATPLRAGFNQPVLLDGSPLNVINQSGGEDSFTLGQGGFVLGGPFKRDRMFYFVSFEGQVLNATREASFAVPTVEERGLFGTGASGIPFGPLTGVPLQAFPTSLEGDAFFSLFPFPNNPGGFYGPYTFTEVLPASARGRVFSAKFDNNFKFGGREQTFAARYNLTDDRRDIPVTGEALFSTLRPRVRTQNFSTFLNSEVTSAVFNQLRLSYGRTRLVFDEVRNPFLLPSIQSPNEPFLLNAPRLVNNTLPPQPGVFNTTGPVIFNRSGTVEGTLGRIGQVNIAGFSPVGVDVFNFPQRRVNNTYQVADNMTWRKGRHQFAFGTDIRRTELNSDLPRNSRTLVTFNGAPVFDFNAGEFTNTFVRPVDFAAAGAPSGVFLSVAREDSAINLRYYQFNFFGQDEWRIRPNFSLSYGLRYEYNTPAREVNNRIESTFTDPLSNPNVAGLAGFIGGRRRIYEPDRNNFGPRIGFAYSPSLFGRDRSTIIRAGYGLYFDQILGAVVSQSRNVFPRFVTVNTGAFNTANSPTGNFILRFFNPATGGVCRGQRNADGTCPPQFFVPLVQPGTLNTINPLLSLDDVLSIFGGGDFVTPFAATLPARQLETPMAHHYSITFEQQLTRNLTLSAAYVGTQGRNLLRFTTPNLGPNNVVVPFDVFVSPARQPAFLGFNFPPEAGRPTAGVGAINRFETTATSRYDALQLQLRGRLKSFLATTQFQVSYTFSKATDDVSDVFDLAGAPALPQNSRTFEGERGPANFDVRHRISYEAISTLPSFSRRGAFLRYLLGGLQFASFSSLQTGQPFTVNSIFDVNLDGNLTDRLDNLNGITITGDRHQPLVLSQAVRENPSLVLANVGEDGRIGRNTFRAGKVLISNVAVIRNFNFTETQTLTFRMEIFNVFNRANFGVPVRFLESPGFGQATETITPARRIQFALKYSF